MGSPTGDGEQKFHTIAVAVINLVESSQNWKRFTYAQEQQLREWRAALGRLSVGEDLRLLSRQVAELVAQLMYMHCVTVSSHSQAQIVRRRLGRTANERGAS